MKEKLICVFAVVCALVAPAFMLQYQHSMVIGAAEWLSVQMTKV